MSDPETKPQAARPTFDALPLSDEVRRAVDELGFVHPTPVQLAVFEPAVKGRDLVVQARTGTGKTAAFGLPLVESLVRRSQKVVQALVLCPTRELALQVKREITGLSKHQEIAVVAVYGGAPIARQIAEIAEGAQIIVGTPGRVLDHLERGTFDPKSLRVLVLDESDEMLSMGFLPQITDIVSRLPPHQTLLFSATLPAAIQRMAETRLKKPEFITLSGDQVGALEISHTMYLSRGDKCANLVQVIEAENPESAVVFCNTRDETKRVAAALESQGFEADWLNADLPQKDRERVMQRTREGRLRFLVATDVAARGIDISHLTHVINHDFPESPEAYVHRTGRTGRAGRTGTAISLVSPSDIGNLYMLRLTYGIPIVERSLPSQRELKTRSEMDLIEMFIDAFAKKTRPHAEDLALARRLLSHELGDYVVAGLIRDHLGARPESAELATAARRARAPSPVATKEALPVRAHAEASEAPGPRERRKEPEDAPTGASTNDSARRWEGPVPRAEGRQREGRPRPDREGLRDTESRASRAPRRRSERSPSSEPFSYTVQDFDPDKADQALASDKADQAPAKPEAQSQNWAEVFVNLGRRDGLRPEQLISVLRSQGLEIGDDRNAVRVRERHSFVSVQRGQLSRALEALEGTELAGKRAHAEEARR